MKCLKVTARVLYSMTGYDTHFYVYLPREDVRIGFSTITFLFFEKKYKGRWYLQNLSK